VGPGVDDDGDAVMSTGVVVVGGADASVAGDGGGSFDAAGCCRKGVAARSGSGGSPACSPRGGAGARRRDVRVPVGIWITSSMHG